MSQKLKIWRGRFPDSYNSPAHRISSTRVVLKLSPRASALSSPPHWQVDLLVLKFVRITRHSWQTVRVSEQRVPLGPGAITFCFSSDTHTCRPKHGPQRLCSACAHCKCFDPNDKLDVIINTPVKFVVCERRRRIIRYAVMSEEGREVMETRGKCL